MLVYNTLIFLLSYSMIIILYITIVIGLFIDHFI